MSSRDMATSGAPTFDDLLRDPTQQFDRRSELLTSVLAYLAAPPATAGTQPWFANTGLSHTWLYAPSSTTGATAVA